MQAATAASSLELWRWVQVSPAVHLVSRRLPTILVPVYPHGLVLHDAVLARSHLRGRSEEAAYAEDPMLARQLRRGLSFVEPLCTAARSTAGTSRCIDDVVPPTVVRRGLPKFFDLDTTALAAALQTASTQGPEQDHPATRPPGGSTLVGARSVLAESLADRLLQNSRQGRSLRALKLGKANGENAQVSFFVPTQQWVLCSKNVAILAGARIDISSPQWSEHRYRFARVVAELWFDQLGTLEESHRNVLREALSTQTLVGELVGGSVHLVDYQGKRSILWFAMVPNHGDEACCPPGRSLSFLRQCGLPVVSMESVDPRATSAMGALDILRDIAQATAKGSIREVGEGYVIYLVAEGEEAPADAGRPALEAEVVWIGKVKTLEYRLLRKLREKAKHFARGGGSIMVERVVSDYRADVQALPMEASLIDAHALKLERLCRYIFAADLHAQVVDESFLGILEQSEHHYGREEPKPAAPALCILAPPMLVTKEILDRLGAQLSSKGAAICAESLACSGGLSAAWHRIAACQVPIYLCNVPVAIERMWTSKRLSPPRVGSASKRRKVTAEERQLKAVGSMAAQFADRCLFVLWGWSEQSCARSLELASDPGEQGTFGEDALGSEACKFRRQGLVARRALLAKWQAQSQRLRGLLPGASTLCLPQAPTRQDGRALATIAQCHEAVRGAGAGRPAATVVVAMALGLPGMGKSSLLARIHRLCGSSARCVFEQGRALPAGFSEPPAGGVQIPRLAAVSLLSSDGFTAAEMSACGFSPASCTQEELNRCRRRAAEQYRSRIEEFMGYVERDCRLPQASELQVDPPVYLLLLDKNYPPAALRREVEVLSALTPPGLRLWLKGLALMAGPRDSVAASGPEECALASEEEREFGPWRYPWSLDVVLECAARLLMRSGHDTLDGGEKAIFVLLSFLQLHAGCESLAGAAGLELAAVPSLSASPELVSWADARGEALEAIWRRFESRAVTREALRGLRPFGDPAPSKPAVAALRKCLLAAGLQEPPELSRRLHVHRCAEGAVGALLAAPQQGLEEAEEARLQPAPPVRYVALAVHAHREQLESLLRLASTSMAAGVGVGRLDEPFPPQLYRRPDFLHITMLYLGGEVPSEGERLLLSASRRMLRSGSSFDCTVTHVVCARGALACAVVDAEHLRAVGAPLGERALPHITLCTRPPWQPKHSGDVLAAMASAMDNREEADDAGRWLMSLRVGSALLDVHVFRLPEACVLRQNPVRLL